MDQEALLAELRRGRIWAALDVFEPEPLAADHPLRTLDNVLLTPHIAGMTRDSYYGLTAKMVDEIERFFQGEPLRYRSPARAWPAWPDAIRAASTRRPRGGSMHTYPIGLPKQELDTPALCLDADALERNIARMAGFLAGQAGSAAPAHQDAQVPHHRLDAAARRGHRHHLRQAGRGRGDGRRRASATSSSPTRSSARARSPAW